MNAPHSKDFIAEAARAGGAEPFAQVVGSGVVIPANAPDHGQRVMSVLDRLCGPSRPCLPERPLPPAGAGDAALFAHINEHVDRVLYGAKGVR